MSVSAALCAISACGALANKGIRCIGKTVSSSASRAGDRQALWTIGFCQPLTVVCEVRAVWTPKFVLRESWAAPTPVVPMCVSSV